MRRARQEGAGGALIAVIITLVALLILAVLSFTRTQAGGEDREQSTARLNGAAAAIESYASAAARLPCPANPNPATAALDGLEVTTGATGCQFDGGTIPWKTIGMRREDSIDTWGRKISYRVFTGNTGFTQAGGASMAHCDTNEALPGGTTANGLCKADHTTTPAEFVAGKGLDVTDLGMARKAAYVLISHGLSGMGGWTASGVQLDMPLGDERDNTRDNGPFWIKPFSGPDVGVSLIEHFDDLVVYRTVEDMAKRSNLAARNWPDDILSAITFNRATVGAAIGNSSPPANTGRDSIAFNNATVRGFDSGGAQNIAFVSGGVDEDAIGGVGGGDGLIGSATGEGLQIDFSEDARQLAFTLENFDDILVLWRERVELRFFVVTGLTVSPVATVVKQSCSSNGKSASFSVDPGATFNRVEVRALTTTTAFATNFPSAFGLAEIRTCVASVACVSGLQASGNACP